MIGIFQYAILDIMFFILDPIEPIKYGF